jgi:hypothetical protein
LAIGGWKGSERRATSSGHLTNQIRILAVG